jgi:V8-like Glu-specific endopeptidase
MISIRKYVRFDRFIIDSNEKVLGNPVKNTTLFPYCLIGQITTPKISGTGILISPVHVLTCAHLVYDCEACKIIFKLELNNQEKKYEFSNGKRVVFSKIFNIKEVQPNKNDWAIIELDRFYQGINR